MPAATRANFAPNPQRRALIGKVKIAQKELGIVDDDYRAIVFQIAGVSSAADCTDAELVKIVEHFKQRGFRPKVAPGKVAKPTRADNPMARKARAMWISLHQLGVVRNPAEPALEAFACQQLKCDRMQWADQGKAYKLIEALKAMGTRAGWHQDLTGVPRGSHVHALRVRLCEAILKKLQKLGFAPHHWDLGDAAWHLCGIKHAAGETIWDTSRLDLIASGLGAKLRSALGVREDNR